jgi:hypothetical protein
MRLNRAVVAELSGRGTKHGGFAPPCLFHVLTRVLRIDGQRLLKFWTWKCEIDNIGDHQREGGSAYKETFNSGESYPLSRQSAWRWDRTE